jgi:hypothetical protein
MIANDIRVVDHHRCGGCGYMTQYVRDGEDLFFDGGCGCSSGGLTRRSWDDAAGWINMQTKPESKAKLMRAFGLSGD